MLHLAPRPVHRRHAWVNKAATKAAYCRAKCSPLPQCTGPAAQNAIIRSAIFRQFCPFWQILQEMARRQGGGRQGYATGQQLRVQLRSVDNGLTFTGATQVEAGWSKLDEVRQG